MNALSVRLPWAFLLCYRHEEVALKDVENRSWHTDYRGSLYIHASKTIGDEEDRTAAFKLLVKQLGMEKALEIQREYRRLLPNMPGAVIGEQNIVDCRYWEDENKAADFSLWHMPGSYGFYMNSPKLLERFIPYKGSLRFFNVTQARTG